MAEMYQQITATVRQYTIHDVYMYINSYNSPLKVDDVLIAVL